MKKILLLSLILSTPIFAQDKPKETPKEPELSELSKLKIENFQLKVALTQCRVDLTDRESKLASSNLSSEQLKLVEDLRAELKAGKDDKFNWETLKFEKVKKDEKDPSR